MAVAGAGARGPSPERGHLPAGWLTERARGHQRTVPAKERNAGDAGEALREYQRSGDRAIRNTVVDDHRWLAIAIAREFKRGSEPLDDLIQVASMGLLKAAERFDPEFGAAFTSYASVTIRGELRRYYRDHGWSIRVPRRLQELRYEIRSANDVLSNRLRRSPTTAETAAHLHVSVDDVIDALCADDNYRSKSLDAGDDDRPTLADGLGLADAAYDEVEAAEAFRALTARCQPRTRLLLSLRYIEGMKQADIADRLGVSQVHVSRLLTQAHRDLRARADASMAT